MMTSENDTTILGGLDSLTKDPHATEDFSKETAELLTKAEGLAKAGQLLEAVDELLLLEKKARQASDAVSASKLTCAVLRLFRQAENWKSVNEYVVLLTKKRGQLKRAIVDMVQQCMTWIDETPNKTIQLDLIKTLSSVSEGKIFIEVEGARLTRTLARIKEEEGNIEEAATLLQEVQVETFGAMEQREKAEYILDQMRLVLLKKDFVRCQIISRKINPKLLEKEEFQDIKLVYHEHMVKYYLKEEKYLDVCKAYNSMFRTANVQINMERWKPVIITNEKEEHDDKKEKDEKRREEDERDDTLKEGKRQMVKKMKKIHLKRRSTQQKRQR